MRLISAFVFRCLDCIISNPFKSKLVSIAEQAGLSLAGFLVTKIMVSRDGSTSASGSIKRFVKFR